MRPSIESMFGRIAAVKNSKVNIKISETHNTDKIFLTNYRIKDYIKITMNDFFT